MRPPYAAAGAAVVLGLGLLARAAYAEPQGNAGLTVGFVEQTRTNDSRGAFHLGMRADLLFLRSRGRDMAIGPYADVVTAAFDTLELGGGAEWLVPTRDEFPFVFSAGLFERRAPGVPWETGAAGGVFFGSRSFNFHSWYGLAAGLLVQGRTSFGDSGAREVIIAAQLDLAFLVMPVLLAYEAIRY